MISTALKQGQAEEAWVAGATASMTRLNRDAAEALHEIDAAHPTEKRAVHAVTDVTGFAMLGHAREMAIGSGVSMKLDHARMEYLPGAIEAARRGFFSGGMKNNRDFVESCTSFASGVPDEFRALLFDPQTSGGLLAAIAPESAVAALAALQRRNVSGRIVGEVTTRRSPLLEVV